MKHKVSIKVIETYTKEMVKEMTIDAKDLKEAEAEALATLKASYMANEIFIPSSFKYKSHSIEIAK